MNVTKNTHFIYTYVAHVVSVMKISNDAAITGSPVYWVATWRNISSRHDQMNLRFCRELFFHVCCECLYHWFCLAFFILHTVSSYTTNERQAVESINTNQRKRTRMRTDDEGADDSNAADDDTVRKLCKRWVGSGIEINYVLRLRTTSLYMLRCCYKVPPPIIRSEG